jgi:hypothetical protein
MRDAPAVSGVDPAIIFLLWNASDRFMPSRIWSPSLPADGGYASTSSNMTTRRLMRRNPEPLFAPTSDRTPPGNALCVSVAEPFPPLPLSSMSRNEIRDSTGTSRSIGAIVSFENPFASSTVGCTTSIELGSCAMKYAIAELMQSVKPTRADFCTTMIGMRGSVIASSSSFW